jgi:hypothetical protein
VVKQGDAGFIELTEAALAAGGTVVVDQVTGDLSLDLQSLMRQQVSGPAGQRTI